LRISIADLSDLGTATAIVAVAPHAVLYWSPEPIFYRSAPLRGQHLRRVSQEQLLYGDDA
jgi:hypothetical protein